VFLPQQVSKESNKGMSLLDVDDTPVELLERTENSLV
jgi:hypothetical protein